MNAHVICHAGADAATWARRTPAARPRRSGRWLGPLCTIVEYFCGLVLAVDVCVVFVVRHPALLPAQPGGLGRGSGARPDDDAGLPGRRDGAGAPPARRHRGLPRPAAGGRWREPAVQLGGWAVAGVAGALCYSSVAAAARLGQRQHAYRHPAMGCSVLPVFAGALFMTRGGHRQRAVRPAARGVWGSLAAAVAAVRWPCGPGTTPDARHLGDPALGAAHAGLPGQPDRRRAHRLRAGPARRWCTSWPTRRCRMIIYSQQVMAGMDHFVLLAIPFFVLAGLIMESNGMSTRGSSSCWCACSGACAAR